MSNIWTENHTNNLLLVLSFAKLLLIAMFFASFGLIEPVHSQDQAKCTGTDLMAKYQAEQPELFAKINEAADKEINGRSIFWKVEKDDAPVSYLFGTMHMSDPEISTLPDDVINAITVTDQMVVEAVDALDPQKAQAAMLQLSNLTFLQNGTLRDLVKDDLEDELQAALAERGLPMQVADRMQPWLIATMVALPVCEIQRKQSGEKVLDGVLVEKAQSAGKPLQGLETAKEQFEAIASLPQDYHVSALEETLTSGGGGLDMIETLKVLYKQGNIAAVFPVMRAAMPQTVSGPGAAKFQEALVEKRNLTMVARMLPMLRETSSFVAVGALHLPGTTGIVEQLRKHGFSVTSLR